MYEGEGQEGDEVANLLYFGPLSLGQLWSMKGQVDDI